MDLKCMLACREKAKGRWGGGQWKMEAGFGLICFACEERSVILASTRRCSGERLTDERESHICAPGLERAAAAAAAASRKSGGKQGWRRTPAPPAAETTATDISLPNRGIAFPETVMSCAQAQHDSGSNCVGVPV